MVLLDLNQRLLLRTELRPTKSGIQSCRISQHLVIREDQHLLILVPQELLKELNSIRNSNHGNLLLQNHLVTQQLLEEVNNLILK